MRATHRDFTRYFQLIVKRVFDIAVSAIALLVLSPLFMLVSLAVKLETGGPIFTVEHLYSCNNQHVRAVSFRTRSHRSVSAFGRVLIRSGLDHFPMLINVLRGEMSIVGPYSYFLPLPQLIDQMPPALLNGAFRPGLVSFESPYVGRELSRADADLFYLSNWSLALDLRILFRFLLFRHTYFQNRP
jgi:lipopolysaccharide/colanic/teichoic acid biosynthesis glycosyltransferase